MRIIAKRLPCGIAILPLLAGVALAETPKRSHDIHTMPLTSVASPQFHEQLGNSETPAKEPIRLSEKQMDKVAAGATVQFYTVGDMNLYYLGTRTGGSFYYFRR